MEIVSLPVGGTMIRIAWGSTIRRITLSRVMPKRLGRLGLPGVHRGDPGPDDLGHVGRLVQPEREQPADQHRDERGRVEVQELRAERDAQADVLVEWPRYTQKMIWTSTGVPRKNQM